MSKRRDFIVSAVGLSAAAMIGTNTAEIFAQGNSGKITQHELPPLPYDYDALEPYIDKATLTLHHDKHHAGYVRGLNRAEEMLAEARNNGDYSMLDHWLKKAAFHGGGHFYHSLYWKSMAPNGGGKPGDMLMQKLTEDFGSFDKFKEMFGVAAKSVEGSGWAILAMRPEDKRLLVFQTENHQKQTPLNVVPVMVIDVWEHAYYLKYQNKRGDYIDAWWNLVNWDFVEKGINMHG